MLKLHELPARLQELITKGFQLRKFERGARPAKAAKNWFPPPPSSGEGKFAEDHVVASVDDADLMVSLNTGDPRLAGTHSILLDIDREAFLVPSSTPGHSHLIIPAALRWDQYIKLLRCLADLGIVEHGYVAASLRREYSALRLPWVEKPKKWEEGGDKGKEFIDG